MIKHIFQWNQGGTGNAGYDRATRPRLFAISTDLTFFKYYGRNYQDNVDWYLSARFKSMYTTGSINITYE